jgi:hypothetical protein
MLGGSTSQPKPGEVARPKVSLPAYRDPVKTDSDGDGLTDDEERLEGTKADSPDTDGDELYDGEEVKSWQSSPLHADSDGDGAPDGTEVRAGSNPTDATIRP